MICHGVRAGQAGSALSFDGEQTGDDREGFEAARPVALA
jgi:hypothetical protein